MATIYAFVHQRILTQDEMDLVRLQTSLPADQPIRQTNISEPRGVRTLADIKRLIGNRTIPPPNGAMFVLFRDTLDEGIPETYLRERVDKPYLPEIVFL